MAILPRYVLFEVVKVFLVSVTALTLLVIIGYVGREAASQGLPMGPTIRLVPYFLPITLRITIPMTLLLACTSVFARMSGANEIVAVKAMGISPVVLLLPVYVFAFLMSLLTVWLNDLAVSWGQANIQKVALGAVEEIIYSMLQAQNRYSAAGLSINVKGVEGRRLVGPTVTIQGKGNSPNITIRAEEAELRSDRSENMLTLILRNGIIEMGKMRVQFPDVYTREIPLADASRAKPSGAAGIALRSIREKTNQLESELRRHEAQMIATAACQMICGDFDDFSNGQWKAAEDGRADLVNQLYRLLAEPNRRWSGGFCCLCFAWVGAPMAIRLRNRDFLTSFFLCYLPILLVYYPLLISCSDGAKSGNLPTISVWAGNFLLLAWGSWLLRNVLRY